LVPLQPPEAVQDRAFVELQVNMEVPPAATAFGLAVSVAVGTTLTVILAAPLVPPGPVQISEKVVLVATAPVLCVPLAGKVPVQPPEAAQDVAFVELQVNAEALPAAMAIGLAASVAVGTTFTVMLAGLLIPPGPAQVSE
jgi:hypothetical protein